MPLVRGRGHLSWSHPSHQLEFPSVARRVLLDLVAVKQAVTDLCVNTHITDDRRIVDEIVNDLCITAENGS